MLTSQEQALVLKALQVIQSTANKSDLLVTDAQAAKDYCRLQLAMSEREEFGVLFLDARNNLIAFEVMFQGSINTSAVYPREVVKRGLALNVNSVIVTHNHPGGTLEASSADKAITKRLCDALGLIDVRVLDHIIVTKEGALSFAEAGLL